MASLLSRSCLLRLSSYKIPRKKDCCRNLPPRSAGRVPASCLRARWEPNRGDAGAGRCALLRAQRASGRPHLLLLLPGLGPGERPPRAGSRAGHIPRLRGRGLRVPGAPSSRPAPRGARVAPCCSHRAEGRASPHPWPRPRSAARRTPRLGPRAAAAGALQPSPRLASPAPAPAAHR